MFDDWEAGGRPWEPDSNRPEMSTSLIFGAQKGAMGTHEIPLFPGNNGGSAGLILRPGITKIRCGKAVDSSGSCKWNGWCSSSRLSRPWTETQDKLCAWRVRDFGAQLKRLTEHQERYHHLDNEYNEIIVDGTWWASHMPDVVEAVFGDRNAHTAFLAAYRSEGISDATHPFVTIDRNDWTHPIRSR